MAPTEGIASSLRRLYGSLPRLHRRRLAVVLGVMVAGALAEVVAIGAVLPFLAFISSPHPATTYPRVAEFFHWIGWSDTDHLLVPITIFFATAAITAGAVRILLSWTSARFVYYLGHYLAAEVYRKVLYQPYSYHVARNSSETVAAIQNVYRVTQSVLVSLMQALTGTAIGLCIAATLFAVDPIVSLGAFGGFGVIYFFVGRLTRKRLDGNSKVVAATQQSRIQAIQEGLGGIRELLLDGTQPVSHARFDDLDRAYSSAQVTTAFIGEAPRFIVEAAAMVLIAFLALFMSTRPGGLAAALPFLGALALGSQRLLPLIQLLHLARTRLRANWHILHEVLDLLELPVPDTSSADRAERLPFSRSVRLEAVSFRYLPDGPNVLSALDLTITKGMRLGIIGKTGGGKSTLMDLLMGLLVPTAGHILVDGVELEPRTLPRWQAIVAHVPQMIFLADATVAENIAFGIPPANIDMDRVRRSARKAQLDEFIQGLPEGYATKVGERGVRLSGGQRQRVGIARALYKDARVLVFDEATSALDAATEAAVMDSINGLGRDLTLIIVAHRLSTVNACDQIVRLDGGQIAEVGDYKTVVGRQMAGVS